MRLWKVLVDGPFPLDEVRDGVQAEAVNAHVQPEAHHAEHRLEHERVVEVEVRLMREEAVPVVLAGHLVERPVGPLGVDKDDSRVAVFGIGVAPDVEVALG